VSVSYIPLADEFSFTIQPMIDMARTPSKEQRARSRLSPSEI
jgi:hypothetical protein